MGRQCLVQPCTGHYCVTTKPLLPKLLTSLSINFLVYKNKKIIYFKIKAQKEQGKERIGQDSNGLLVPFQTPKLILII